MSRANGAAGARLHSLGDVAAKEEEQHRRQAVAGSECEDQGEATL